jgi:hypothetical protein
MCIEMEIYVLSPYQFLVEEKIRITFSRKNINNERAFVALLERFAVLNHFLTVCIK